MHYNPVVEAFKESNHQEVANPKYDKLKKKAGELKKELVRCKVELGRLPLATNKDGSLRKSKKRKEAAARASCVNKTSCHDQRGLRGLSLKE